MLRMSTEDFKGSFIYKWFVVLLRGLRCIRCGIQHRSDVARRMALTVLPVTDKSSLGRRQGFSKMTLRRRGEGEGRLRFFERLRNPKMLKMEILYLSTQAPSGVAWRGMVCCGVVWRGVTFMPWVCNPGLTSSWFISFRLPYFCHFLLSVLGVELKAQVTHRSINVTY